MGRRLVPIVWLVLFVGACSAQVAEEATADARPNHAFPDRDKWAQAARIDAWMAWVKKQNPKLSDLELRLIVESVLYYSYSFEIDHRLAFAVIKAESNFDPRCSYRGAVGLTQLMASTAAGLGVDDRTDIRQSVMGGLKYLAKYLHQHAGRSNLEQTRLGLACYNAGPVAVKRAGGVPDNGTTPKYVNRVCNLFLKLYRDGMP